VPVDRILSIFYTLKISRLPFFLFHAGHTALAISLQKRLVTVDSKPERVRALNVFRNGARLRAMRWQVVIGKIEPKKLKAYK
jgi:hypothetical protein